MPGLTGHLPSFPARPKPLSFPARPVPPSFPTCSGIPSRQWLQHRALAASQPCTGKCALTLQPTAIYCPSFLTRPFGHIPGPGRDILAGTESLYNQRDDQTDGVNFGTTCCMKLLIINQFRTRLKMAETATGCRIVPLPVILSSYRHPRLVRGSPAVGPFRQTAAQRPALHGSPRLVSVRQGS